MRKGAAPVHRWASALSPGLTPGLTCPVLVAVLGTWGRAHPEGTDHLAGETGQLGTSQAFSGPIITVTP